MKGLKHEADMAAAQREGALVIVQHAQIAPFSRTVPSSQLSSPAMQLSSVDLPARLADDGDELARCHVERDVAENGNVAITLAQLADFQAHRPLLQCVLTRSNCSSAVGASQATTSRCGMERSQVIWRLANWRVAKMPLSRKMLGLCRKTCRRGCQFPAHPALPRLPVADAAHRRQVRRQVSPGAQGLDFIDEAGGQHRVKALGNARMQPGAILGFRK